MTPLAARRPASLTRPKETAFPGAAAADVHPGATAGRRDTWVSPHRALVAVLALGLCLYHASAILDFGIGRVDGKLYPLVDDDVMISMRFGRQLARGEGLVYNPGERVEGFTNPLLTLSTAALHLLPVEPRILPGLLMGMNVVLSLTILWMLLRFWGDTAAGRVAGVVAGVFYVALPSHAWYAHAGYEVYMQMAILLYSVWRIDRFRPIHAIVLGLLPLSHGTALVMWAVLVAAILLFARGSWGRAWMLAGLAVIPFAAYELFRLAYYGESLPNTYWLKAGAGSLRGGAHHAAAWLLAVAPVAALGVYAVLTSFSAKRWLMALLIVVHGLSVVSLGGDILPQFRFLLPCSLLLVALAGAGAADFLKLPWQRYARSIGPATGWSRLPTARAAVVAALIAMAIGTTVYTYRKEAPGFQAQRRWNIRHIATGLALNENTRPDDVVALFGLGFTGYFGDRFTIDMLGKADHHIARQTPVPGRPIGHNKTDIDYVLSREPAYVEMNLSPARFADRPWLTRQQQSDQYGYVFDLALEPAFRERYAVRLNDREGRRVPFAVRAGMPATPWRVPDAFYANLEPWAE